MYNDVCSDRERVLCGVPQGSILGSLLFLLYINDIANVSDKVYAILFADDSNIFCTGKDIHNMINIMNLELNKINEWLNVNKLSLSVKSSYMIFSRSRISLNTSICINGKTLKRIYETNFVGVYNDCNLTVHCEYTADLQVCKSHNVE